MGSFCARCPECECYETLLVVFSRGPVCGDRVEMMCDQFDGETES